MGLPSVGLSLAFVLPSTITGLELRLQGFVLSPFALNGLFAATDAHEITIL